MNTAVLARRLLDELRLVAHEGGGQTAAVAAARWVGAHRADVALAASVEPGETDEVLDLVALVLVSLEPATA